jgi:POT family proton-dependent oligopeptide transporter
MVNHQLCVVTVGELLLSPMGLSLVSKLSPVRITFNDGGWFWLLPLATNYQGTFNYVDTYSHKAGFFWLNFGLLMVATIMCFAMLKWLNKIMKEKGVS